MQNNGPNVGFFGTGEKEYGEGGSGIKVLLDKIKSGDIRANIEAIVSNYRGGGITQKAYNSGMLSKMKYIDDFPIRGENSKFSEENLAIIRDIYQTIVKENNLEYVFLSGWLKYVLGLEANKTINIHPGPTQAGYGGKGMYGDKVHKKIWNDYTAGKINQTCVTMHYVTEQFDDPRTTIAQIPVTLEDCNSWEDVKSKVNKMEHEIQWKITKMIVNKDITWTGNIGDSIEVDKIVKDSFNFPEGSKFGENIDL